METTDEKRQRRIKTLGRTADTIQIIALGTMGQYIYEGGSQQLSAKHWAPVRDLMGGYQNVGLSLIFIALIGLVGVFSLAVTKTDRVYTVIMWVFSALAIAWFWTIGGFHGYASATIPGAGSTGAWTLGLAGMFFLFTRLAITIGVDPYSKDHS